MTVRLYLHKTPEDCKDPMNQFTRAWSKARGKYVDLVKWGHCENSRIAVWLEFDSEEEAALFKLSDSND